LHTLTSSLIYNIKQDAYFSTSDFIYSINVIKVDIGFLKIETEKLSNENICFNYIVTFL